MNRPDEGPDTGADGTIELRDGRRLRYGAWGLPGGIPVLGFHGTGASRLIHYGDEVPRAAGVRLILPDRPGYGLSDPHPSGTLLEWARDMEELANALRFDRFAVFGVSGGGPPALACGFALHERVAAVALVSSVGPCQDEPELVPHLPERRRRLVELARRDPAAAEAMIRRDCEEDIAAIARDPRPRSILGLQAPQTRTGRSWLIQLLEPAPSPTNGNWFVGAPRATSTTIS